MNYEIVEKYYSTEDSLFHMVKRDIDTYERVEEKYDTFKQFYKAINQDLTDANLLGYNFDDYNPKKIDFKNAKISSLTMIKLGTYDNSIEKLILKSKDMLLNTPSKFLESFPTKEKHDLLDTSIAAEKGDIAILYISDLHLDYKLLKAFPSHVNEFELEAYFRDVILKLKKLEFNYLLHYNVIIVGDVSHNFELFKFFFNIYSEMIYLKTFFILGNHELWDTNFSDTCSTFEEIVEIYRTYLASINITLLENELYISGKSKNIYSEDEILSMTKKEMSQILAMNSYAIFGGMGFAGLNKEFNCNGCIYGMAPITREKEINKSKRITDLHDKLAELIPTNKVLIFATHMPKKDWTSKPYISNWYYISGHTHVNMHIDNDKVKVYADNQIGYKNTPFKFKCLIISSKFNIFDNFRNGIYKISREQYKLFYIGLHIPCSFNTQFKSLYMLKKNGIYCFLMKKDNGELYLLNGGIPTGIKNHTINYLFNNISDYATSINMFLNSYNIFQKTISKDIQEIGGSGNIHGCIIDIDFYNHVYINPLDKTVTVYFANSMTDKTVYKNLPSLLKMRCLEMYKTYEHLTSLNVSNQLVKLGNDLVESNKTKKVYSTEMYKISRIIKNLQFTTTYNIVRLWNENIICDKSEQTGKLMVNAIINPKEIGQIYKEQNERKEKQKLNFPKVKKHNRILTKEEIQLKRVERYKQKIDEITNNNISVVYFVNTSSKATYKCNSCGNVWSIRPDHFKDKQQYKCPKCKK